MPNMARVGTVSAEVVCDYFTTSNARFMMQNFAAQTGSFKCGPATVTFAVTPLPRFILLYIFNGGENA